MAVKRPSFQFYPGDWLRSTDLRSCSIGARGLWIDMICLMHEGVEYGYLKVGSKVILPPNLARMVGATLSEVEGWLDELVTAGVVSTDEQGCYLCRRMIRDEEIRVSRAAGGTKGGNPSLVGGTKDNQKVTDKVGGKVNLPANLRPTPSSASSSASAELDYTQGDRETFLTGRSEAFNRFMAVYPRPRSPEAAWQVWQAKVYQLAMQLNRPDSEIEEMLIAKAAEYRDSPAGMPPPNGSDYRPNPNTWLLDHKFEESAEVWREPNGKQPKAKGGFQAKKDLSAINAYFAERGLGDATTGV